MNTPWKNDSRGDVMWDLEHKENSSVYGHEENFLVFGIIHKIGIHSLGLAQSLYAPHSLNVCLKLFADNPLIL